MGVLVPQNMICFFVIVFDIFSRRRRGKGLAACCSMPGVVQYTTATTASESPISAPNSSCLAQCLLPTSKAQPLVDTWSQQSLERLFCWFLWQKSSENLNRCHYYVENPLSFVRNVTNWDVAGFVMITRDVVPYYLLGSTFC